MQEVFEKIKEKINEYMELVYECSLDDVIEFQRNHSDSKVAYIVEGFYEAYEIINQVAEDYNNGWIPVEERLPSKEECLENDNRFIVTDGNRTYQDDFDIYADGYNEPKWVYSNDMVIAWQPLPEPYKPKGERE